MYNFDEFVKDYRPSNADNNIKKQFRFEFETKDVDGEQKVFVRTKGAIGAKTPWKPHVQIYPSLLDLRAHRPHSPTTIPSLADNNEWERFETKVQPSLTK